MQSGSLHKEEGIKSQKDTNSTLSEVMFLHGVLLGKKPKFGSFCYDWLEYHNAPLPLPVFTICYKFSFFCDFYLWRFWYKMPTEKSPEVTGPALNTNKQTLWKSLDCPVHALGAGTGPEHFQLDPDHRSLLNIEPCLNPLFKVSRTLPELFLCVSWNIIPFERYTQKTWTRTGFPFREGHTEKWLFLKAMGNSCQNYQQLPTSFPTRTL